MPSPRRQPTEEYDLSSIQPPVKLGVNGAEQIARCLGGGSEEIKHLLRQECHIIFECSVCSSLFRSLANFLAHKRVYCKEDHLLPSSDLASHVSILRQYIQTKAAAMATLAEGANNQPKQAGGNADIPPEEFIVTNVNSPTEADSGSKTDQSKHDISNHLDTPKKKKLRTHHVVTPETPPENNEDKLKPIEKSSSSTKKKKACESDMSGVKKSQVKRKLMGGIPGEGMNGDLNIADTFVNHRDILPSDDSTNCKKNKTPKSKSSSAVSLKSMECSVVMNEKDLVLPVPATQTTSSPKVSEAVTKSVKSTHKTSRLAKKDLTPHLLYPCLYCENVFPGTRMAIDHITAVHKKRKSVNVSKIRTKIRKKAFVVKSGKKMRRFQKNSKSSDKDKEKDNSSSEEKELTDEVPTSPEDDSKGGKRSQASHSCNRCGKIYLYKTVLERHKVGCMGKQKTDCTLNTDAAAPEPTQNSPTSPPISSFSSKSLRINASITPSNNSSTKHKAATSPKSTSSSSSKCSNQKGSSSVKKTPNSKSTSTVITNCRVVGELVLSPCDSIKVEPPSPACTPTGREDSNGDLAATPGSSKESPIFIPVKSEYPCPYCMMKPRKTFELLFTHISDKHKDLRPSRKRVVRFLMNSGYKCSWCKSPPRFFKNRVLLRRHREKEHGMTYTTPSLIKANDTSKANGTSKVTSTLKVSGNIKVGGKVIGTGKAYGTSKANGSSKTTNGSSKATGGKS